MRLAAAVFGLAWLPAVAHAQDPRSGTIQTMNDGGQTIVFIAPIFVANGVTFSAAYAYPQGAPATPATVMLSFATGRGGPDFSQSRNLIILLNQQTELAIGMMEYDAQNNMVRRFVPLDAYRQIAQASHVSGQVGAAAFEIPPRVQQAMQELLSRMSGTPRPAKGQ